jgi:hypothetical protein
VPHPPPYPGSNDGDTDTGPDRESTTSTPMWVKLLGIIVILLVVLFVVQHLIGGGLAGLHQ